MKKCLFTMLLFLTFNFSFANTMETPLLAQIQKEYANLNLDINSSLNSDMLSIEQKDLLKEMYDLEEFSFLYIPIIENNIKKGAYIEINGRAVYTKNISGNLYEVISSENNFREKEIITISFDEATNTYTSSKPLFWCEAACTAKSLLIVASDGPSPLMDILALAHQIACVADCQK